MTTANTELEILDSIDTGSSVSTEIQNLAAGKAAFMSTIKGNDMAAKVATLEAMTNSEPIKQNLGKTINLVNVVVQSVAIADRNTGEVREQPRVVLLDADGSAYHAISGGLWTSVKNILGILPHPSEWNAPLPIHVIGVQGKSGGDFFTIKMGSAPKK